MYYEQFFTFPPLRKGKLIKRYKRFFADIEAFNGEIITAHNPNTGSMRSLLKDGSPVLYSEQKSLKLHHRLELIRVGEEWVISNTYLANKMVEKFFPFLPNIYKGGEIAPEYKYSDSRFDFRIDEKTLVEVKSVTCFDDACCYFPDAKTVRGKKHLETLTQAAEKGFRSVMLYLCMVKRPKFAIYKEIDPEYCSAFNEAMGKGVEMWTVGVVFDEARNAAYLSEYYKRYLPNGLTEEYPSRMN